MAAFVVFWLILCLVVAMIADGRGRSGIGYFFLSVVLSPLVGLVIVLVAADLKAQARQEEERKREHERQLESIRALVPEKQGQVSEAGGSEARGSVADELAKLGRLKADGLLTEDEFAAQKAKLLA